MLLQSKRVLPPPGHGIPDFKALATDNRAKRVENQWHRVPEAKAKLGLDDEENDLGPDRYFGWDNERPARTLTVHEFEAQSRPISNGEYAWFIESTHQDHLPASWATTDANGAAKPAMASTAPTALSMMCSKWPVLSSSRVRPSGPSSAWSLSNSHWTGP